MKPKTAAFLTPEYIAWMPFLRSRVVVFSVVTALAIACGYYVASVVDGIEYSEPKTAGILWPDGKTLHEFSIVDHSGQRFDIERLRGRWSLLTFGYTSCPDICPVTLSTINRSLAKLAEMGEHTQDIQTVFVSVDPERDSPERLAAWIGHFNTNFVGATGHHEALQRLTTQLGVAYQAGEPDSDGYYAVDHTASVMLIDPQARLVAIFGLPHYPQEIARRFAAIRADSRV